MTSQITPEGFRPVSRARSTAASVWPIRSSTPPGRARSGKTWPGCTRSMGCASAAIATWIVWLRSGARRDARRHALARLDRHREGRPERRLVVIGHRPKTEPGGALVGDAEAD